MLTGLTCQVHAAVLSIGIGFMSARGVGVLLMGHASKANISRALLHNNVASVANVAYAQDNSILVLQATCGDAENSECVNVRIDCFPTLLWGCVSGGVVPTVCVRASGALV